MQRIDGVSGQTRVAQEVIDTLTVAARTIVAFNEAVAAYDSTGYRATWAGERVSTSTPDSTTVERDALGADQVRQARREEAEDWATILAAARRMEARRRYWLAPPSREGAYCEVLAAVGVHRPALFTDCGGILPHKMHLSRWARDWTVRHGRLPTSAIAELHVQGRRPRVSIGHDGYYDAA